MIAPADRPGISISIDRGGTFTDCVAKVPGQDDIVIKLLSVDPAYPDAPVEAIRRVLERATGQSFPKGQKISLDDVQSIKMGTTVATNALLERKGAETAFVVTEGFADLLTIGNQSRPNMFDLAINRPEVLHSEVIEIPERVTLEAWTEQREPTKVDSASDPALVQGITSEIVRVLKPLNVDETRRRLQSAYDKGIRSLAVCLMHSYTFPEHERIVGGLASNIGFTQISLSSVLMPMCKIVPRGHSVNADAYLTPKIKEYLRGFESGFEDLYNSGARCEFMQSDGGLVDFGRLSGLRAVLSGPAGGVVGYAKTSYDPEEGSPVIEQKLELEQVRDYEQICAHVHFGGHDRPRICEQGQRLNLEQKHDRDDLHDQLCGHMAQHDQNQINSSARASSRHRMGNEKTFNIKRIANPVFEQGPAHCRALRNAGAKGREHVHLRVQCGAPHHGQGLPLP